MIAEGATLAVLTGETEPQLEREILKAFTVGEERTFEQDPALAIRLLADIALATLSPTVSRRILRLLDDLTVITPPQRRSALETRRAHIHNPDRQRSAAETA
jgi:uncharacterized membrane protein